MRNFKKLLSLVLCMAVMLSVMVVGAGAAFSDQSKIENTEAVDACSTLNIINGYTDGSFKPEGTITRAEMCKMICVALNGGKDPILGTSATSSFTDTKGHWAEGYIESCVAQGIVAGVGGGKFNPNGNVTGSQAAKMLLTALGFKSDVEKFVGDAWEVNVNVRATQKGLYEDLAGMDVSAALTRDNAAQMIWNTLQAKMVSYKNEFSTVNGQLVATQVLADKTDANGKNVTLLEDKYDATVETGVVTDVGHTSKGYTADVVTEYQANPFTDSAANKTVVSLSKLTDPTDLVGKAVKVMYKATDDVYGIYVNTENTATVVETKLGDLDLNKNEYKLDGTTYKTNATDFGAVEAVDTLGNVLKDSSNAPLADLDAVKVDGTNFSEASDVVLIDYTGDEKIDVAVVTPVVFGQVSYNGASKLTVNGGILSNVDKDDCVLYNGIAKDDFVAVVKGTYVADGKHIVTQLDKVSGKVDAEKGTNDVRIGGSWYTNITGNTYTAGTTEGDYYIYNGYIVKDDAKSGSIADTAYVIKVGSAFDVDGNYQVKVMINGETKIVNAEVATVDSTITTATVDTYCTYEIDNGVYQFKPITSTNKPAGFNDAAVQGYKDKKLYQTSTVSGGVVTVSGTSYIIDSEAVIFVKYKTDKYAVLTGAQVAAWGDKAKVATGTILTKTSDGMIVVKGGALDLGAASIPASTATYGVVTSDVVKGDASKTEFTIWNGTDYIDIITKSSVSSLKKFDLVEYQANSDDTYDVTIVKAATTKQAIVGYSKTSGDINFADGDGTTNAASKVIKDDTLVIFVNTDKNVDANKAGLLGEEIAVSDKPVTTYNTNVIWYDEDGTDADLTVLVIDTVNSTYANP